MAAAAIQEAIKEKNMDKEEITDGKGNVIAFRQGLNDKDFPWAGAERAWNRRRNDFGQWMFDNNIYPDKHNPIDEVALMFPHEFGKMKFLQEAVQEPGVSLFNHAVDEVQTSPISSSYSVEYDFLRKEGSPMRLEAMLITSGFSPLHTIFLNPEWNPTAEDRVLKNFVAVHFSFKVDPDNYQDTLDDMEAAGAVLVQSCSSTYGDFSYWRVEDIGHNIYLKPRCNKRDSNPEPPLPDTTSDRGEFGYPTIGGGYPPIGGRRPIKDTPQA